jgi:hypothetical protein
MIPEKLQALSEPKAASGRRLADAGAAAIPAARGIHSGCESTTPRQIYVALSNLL